MNPRVIKTLLVSTALGTASLAALPALAQTATEPTAEQAAENAAESTEQALESTGTAIENTAENAADATGNALENAADATGNAVEEAGDAAATAADQTGQALENAGTAVENTAENAEAEATDMARDLSAPDMDVPEGYETANMDELTTEDVTGASVYDAADNDIGEVDELIVTEDGKIEAAIIDVGGFLGLGEHTVRLGMDKIQMLRDAESGNLRVRVNETKESLEQMPEYDG